MGLRFYRRLKILPGVRLNLSRSGVSTSIGRRGAWLTFGKRGTRTTVGLPGTGLSYTHLERPHQAHQEASGEAQPTPVADVSPTGRAWRGWLWVALAIAVLASVAYSVAKAEDSPPAVSDVYAVKSPDPDRRGTPQQPLVIQQPADPEHARNERETTQSSIGLAILTGLLFVVNLWLIVDARRVSTRQAEDTQRAIAQQTRAADAMHDVAEATKNNAVLMSGMLSKQMRAYITVEIGSALYQDEHLRFEARPVLINNGLTPARNVCFRVMADILEGHNAPRAPQIEDLLVNDMGLAPRQQVTISRALANRIPDSEVADVMKGSTRRLHAWGRVTYDDVYGGSWETKFYFTYFFQKGEKGIDVRGNFSTSHNSAT